MRKKNLPCLPLLFFFANKKKETEKMKNLNWNLIDRNSSQTLRGFKQKRELHMEFDSFLKVMD